MLRPFDLIMTWQKGFSGILDFFLSGIALIITKITGGGPSHVRVYCKGLGICDKEGREYEFWEVTFPKCKFGFLDEIDPKKYRIEIGRHILLPYPLQDDLRDKGLAAMLKLRGTDYDLGELAFSHFFDEIGLDSTDQSDPEKFVCSSGAEFVLKSMGYPFCILDQLASPQDIRESDYYEKVKVNVSNIFVPK